MHRVIKENGEVNNMREMVLKNMISEDKRRRELFCAEHSQRNNCTQDIEKKSIYAIKEILEITQDFDLELFLKQKKEKGLFKPTKTFIVKIQNTKEAKVKFIYKAFGDQYIVSGDKIFILNVAQYFKIEIFSNPVKV